MTDEFKVISDDTWGKEYIPSYDVEGIPQDVLSKYIWTEVESDGNYSKLAGIHYVNRTGLYWVTENPHDFNVEVMDD